MPHVDSHTPGTINWVDFVSTDLDAATGFYTGLFGWETEDTPMPGGKGSTGSSGSTGGTRPRAGRCRRRWPPGAYSHWNVWVATDSAEEVVAKAAAAGGQVLMAPATLRRAPWLVADPGGAAIGTAAASTRRRVNRPGRDLVGGEHPGLRGLQALRQVFGWAPRRRRPRINGVTWKLGGRVGGIWRSPEWHRRGDRRPRQPDAAKRPDLAARSARRRSTPPTAASPSWPTPPAATWSSPRSGQAAG